MKIISNAKKEMSLGKRPQNYYQKKKKFKDQYFEFHHILPKSIYPLWKNEKRNIVALTYKEHFFCHELLTKIYTGKNKQKMYFALVRFFGKNGKKITESQRKEYAEIISKQHLGKKVSIETRKKLSDSHKGKPAWNKGKTGIFSEDILEKNRQAHLNKKVSEETRKKMSNSQKNNEKNRFKQGFYGEENGFYGKHHKKETIDKIKEKLSNKFSGSGNPCFGRKWFHNPVTMERVYLKPDDVIPEGYIPGTGINYNKKKK